MSKILTVSFFNGLLVIVRMVSGFLIAKAVAIYTGPAGFAMLGQTQNFFNVLNGIVASPSGNAIVRYTAENHSTKDPQASFKACALWWRASVIWTFFFFLILASLAYFSSYSIATLVFGDQNYYWLVIITVLALPLSVANKIIASVLNGQQKNLRYVSLGIISVIVATIITLTLIVNEKLKGAMIATAIFMSLCGIIMLLGSLREPWFKIKYWFGKTGHKQIIGIRGYVAMAITSSISMPIALIAVQKILITKVGIAEAGHWQAVYKISEVYLGFVTITLSTYFLPKLASLRGVDEILNEIHATAKIVMPIVLMLAAIVFILRDFAITLLFTEEFRSARNLFAIQLLGDVVKIFAWLYAFPMLSRGATKWYICTEIGFSVCFVILTYFSVIRWDLQGANIAYLLSYLLYLNIMLLNVKKFSK